MTKYRHVAFPVEGGVLKVWIPEDATEEELKKFCWYLMQQATDFDPSMALAHAMRIFDRGARRKEDPLA